MKVFISWSGERSKQVAELFKWWLKCVVQASDPWVSTQDIESGSVWFNEIGTQLADTSIGIICLTNENKDKPWILFEAGALTKGLSTSRVIPFLIDLEPHDIHPPLSQLNAVSPTEQGLFAIAGTVNSQIKEPNLSTDVFRKVFDTYYPQFDTHFKNILGSTPNHEKPDTRKDKDILSEILTTVRGFDRRIRSLENYNPEESKLAQTNTAPKGVGRSIGKILPSTTIRLAIQTLHRMDGAKIPSVDELSTYLREFYPESLFIYDKLQRELAQYNSDFNKSL